MFLLESVSDQLYSSTYGRLVELRTNIMHAASFNQLCEMSFWNINSSDVCVLLLNVSLESLSIARAGICSSFLRQ